MNKDNKDVTSTNGYVATRPKISGNRLDIDIYNYLNHIASNIGEKTTEYHWREVCGLMLGLEEEKRIVVEFPKE